MRSWVIAVPAGLALWVLIGFGIYELVTHL